MKTEMGMKANKKPDGFCYQELLTLGKRVLTDAEISDADLDSFWLLEYVTGMNRGEFFLNSRKDVPYDKVKRYMELLERRRQHIPLQYIIGEQEFMGYPFYVNEHVLIPRQDTECLVESVLPYAQGRRVLDMCTGSGCIAVSLMLLGNPAECHAVDISRDALTVAERNAKRNHAQITFIESDLFGQVTERYDVIVSNPPYIPPAVIEGLSPEVREHEPRHALDGGEDGLCFYRLLAKDSVEHLQKDGMLFFEIGCDQATDVMAIMREAGFREVVCRKDYAGNDRVVSGRYDAHDRTRN